MTYLHQNALNLWANFCRKHQAELTPEMIKAGEFALEAHRGQMRKCGGLPYVSHLFDVADIMLEAHLPENLVIAGLLHDVIEDTNCGEEDIRALFEPERGDEVMRIIMADNESDKTVSWEERKTETINYARETDEIDGLLLICVDKISNLSSMVENLEASGDLMWHYFHSPKEKQIWYYESLYNIFAEKLSGYEHLLKRYFNLLNLIR